MYELDWLDEPSRATKRIIFARHGEYACNLSDTCNCDPRLPFTLTEKGEQQALALGERLHGRIEIIISCYPNCARTCTAWFLP